jgi:hypothetical protein
LGGQLIWRIYRSFPALVLWLFRARLRPGRSRCSTKR